MLFNFWRPYTWFKPKKDGWYQCTVAHGNGLNRPRVMDLYFRTWDSSWNDKRRQNVFDGYKVFESGRAPIDDYRVYSDSECVRIDVVAWRKLPRCYGWWHQKHKKYMSYER